jgi:hypothetical protein
MIICYYDIDRGWENTNKGWHLAVLENISTYKHTQVVDWMYSNLDNLEKHARWIIEDKHAEYKFRYERHYILFTLRWC